MNISNILFGRWIVSHREILSVRVTQCSPTFNITICILAEDEEEDIVIVTNIIIETQHTYLLVLGRALRKNRICLNACSRRDVPALQISPGPLNEQMLSTGKQEELAAPFRQLTHHFDIHIQGEHIVSSDARWCVMYTVVVAPGGSHNMLA